MAFGLLQAIHPKMPRVVIFFFRVCINYNAVLDTSIVVLVRTKKCQYAHVGAFTQMSLTTTVTIEEPEFCMQSLATATHVKSQP